MEHYYQRILPMLEGYTVRGLFDGHRSVEQIVTLQTGHLGQVFFFDQEPLISGIDEPLWDHIFTEPTIFANSELDSEDKEYLAARYPNFIDWYYFANAIVSKEWLNHYRYYRAGRYGGLTKAFLADFGLITGPRQYRLYLYYLLHWHMKHDRAHYSINGTQDWYEDLFRNDRYDLLKLDEDRPIQQVIPYWPVSYDNFGVGVANSGGIPQNTISFEHYSQVDFVLVMETAFAERKRHLTEKIFKAIVAGKPFVLAGGQGNLSYLQRYGFTTFAGCWDESYDAVGDAKARCEAIKQAVGGMYEGKTSSDVNRMFETADWRAEANRNWFWGPDFERVVWTELERNLETAKSRLSAKKVERRAMMAAAQRSTLG